jgi:hypothetical protein
MHSTASRGLFGFGRLRCDTCGGRWGEHGCPSHDYGLRAYLQVSTARDRAEDLKHNSHLFTSLELCEIAEIDRRHQVVRDEARQEGFWSAAYPEMTAGSSIQARTGTHEIIRPVAGAVPSHSPWAPMPFPMEPVAA